MIQTFVRRVATGWSRAQIPAPKSASRTRAFRLIYSGDLKSEGRVSGGRHKEAIIRPIERNPRKLSTKSSYGLRLPSTHRSCSNIASIADMSSATITKPLNEYRLPLDVKPTHYDVTIRTDLEKLSFGGFVKIE